MNQTCNFRALNMPSSCAILLHVLLAYRASFYRSSLKQATALSKCASTYLHTAAESPDCSHSTVGFKFVVYSMIFALVASCLPIQKP